jgi:predicted amidohydrolase
MLDLSIALAQMAVRPGELAWNEAVARRLSSQAVDQGADLLLLPELWHSGYDLARAGEYAAPLDEGAFGLMAQLAREQGLYMAGTALEAAAQGRPYNTAALYTPTGERAGAYRKVHLWAPLGEAEYLAPGQSLPTFQLPWGCVALAICYDLRFPEQWRSYADAGADLVLIPAAWPSRRVEHWRLLLRARAVENQFCVAGCNRAGGGADAGQDRFGGCSSAVDPWGQVVVEAGPEPDLVVARLDLDEVARARRLFPFLADRRPEVYG